MDNAGAQRTCRARGNYSHLCKRLSYQGEPEQRCARKHGFERSGISWILESVDIGTEDTRDRVMRPSWLQEDKLGRVQDSLERNSLGHKWWPGWRPVPGTNVEKLPPEPRRHRRGRHGLGVFQYHCESLRAPDRLYELMALAKRTGADVPCLQGSNV